MLWRPLWLSTIPVLLLLSFGHPSRGSEVYLRSITLFRTHDRDLPGLKSKADVYFFCTGDSRGKTYLRTVREVNRTYAFEEEDVSLTHVNPGQCRVACGIKDEDRFSKDDLFGRTFQICEDGFDSDNHLLEISIPGEILMTMQCEQCNLKPDSPPRAEAEPAAPPAATSRGKSTIVTLAVSGAVLAGMLIGLIVARIVRAWHDEDANEARLRFQALYVDPATDIEDLPDQLPSARRNDPFSWMARSMRKSWLQARGKRPYGMVVPPATSTLE